MATAVKQARALEKGLFPSWPPCTGATASYEAIFPKYQLSVPNFVVPGRRISLCQDRTP